jgi:hypothetical protein
VVSWRDNISAMWAESLDRTPQDSTWGPALGTAWGEGLERLEALPRKRDVGGV